MHEAATMAGPLDWELEIDEITCALHPMASSELVSVPCASALALMPYQAHLVHSTYRVWLASYSGWTRAHESSRRCWQAEIAAALPALS